jgi:hypothetical protein
VYVRFRSPSLLSSRQSMDVDAISDERRQKSKSRMYFCLDSGYRLMQLAKRMGNEGLHILRRGHFFFFGDWLHRCPGKGQDPVRRDEKTKSVVKSVVPTRPANPPIQPTNQPTSQKTKLRRAQGGAKNLLKRRQVRKPFSQA